MESDNTEKKHKMVGNEGIDDRLNLDNYSNDSETSEDLFSPTKELSVNYDSSENDKEEQVVNDENKSNENESNDQNNDLDNMEFYNNKNDIENNIKTLVKNKLPELQDLAQQNNISTKKY